MRFGAMRVGYAGYSRDFSAPGDRRRFAAYTRLKGVPIEYATPDRDYDLGYITYSSDLPGWIARKQREGDRLKLVFELIDSYLAETSLSRRLLKGTARYFLGTDGRLSPDLRRTLIGACMAADAVICSTEEQRDMILRYNPKVFTSFDYFRDDLGAPKEDYRRTDKLRLVWEGQSTTLRNVQAIRDVLNGLRDRIQLHIVTDPVIHRFFGRFGTHPAREALHGIECEVVFHPWERDSYSRYVTAADVAIIPIDSTDAMMRGKPENKLVMMWQLGMPVLTSATPAYQRAMAGAGLAMGCATQAEWAEQLAGLVTASSERLETIGRQCQSFAELHYSREEFMRRLDAALEAIGIPTD